MFTEILRLCNELIEMTLHDLEFLDMEAFSIEKDLTYYLYCSTQHGLAVKIFHVSPEKKYELLDIDAINSFIKKTKLENEIIQRFPIFFKNFLEYLMWKNRKILKKA